MSQLTDYKVDELIATIESLAERVDALEKEKTRLKSFFGGVVFVLTSVFSFAYFVFKEFFSK